MEKIHFPKSEGIGISDDDDLRYFFFPRSKRLNIGLEVEPTDSQVEK